MLAAAGPYALTLSTAISMLAVELHSSYVGHQRAQTTQVAELALGPGPDQAETSTRELAAPELPVVWARRRCLIDHVARLQDLLEERGLGRARIDLDDEALLSVER